MGSIDLPPFLRDEMKKKIQDGKQKPADEIDIPDFLKSEPTVEKKSQVGNVSGIGAENILPRYGTVDTRNAFAQPEVSRKPQDNLYNEQSTITTKFTSSDARVGGDEFGSTKQAKTAAGIYNTLVNSVARFAGGAGEVGQDFDTKIKRFMNKEAGRPENEGVLPTGTYRKENVELVEKLRSPLSTKEEEAARSKFDITDGINNSDVKALLFQAPATILDMAGGALTYGTSFGLQAVNDAAEELDNNPNAQNLSDSQRMGYIYTNGLIQGALERLGVNKIIKNTGASKFIQKKLFNELTEELLSKGEKVTADQIEKEVIKKVTSLSSQLKNKGLSALNSIGWEGGTEGLQQGLSDLSKLATNKLAGSEVFDEKDITENFLKNVINASAQGGAMGGLFSGVHSMLSNNAESLKNEINNAKTQSQIEEVKNKINAELEKGSLTKSEVIALQDESKLKENVLSAEEETTQPEPQEELPTEEKVTPIKESVTEPFLGEKEVGDDLLTKAVDEGKVTGIYADLVKQGKGEDVYKEISQQYFNIGNDGSQLTDGKIADIKKATIDQFGEEVVNEAIKKYPYQEVTEPSTVSGSEYVEVERFENDGRLGEYYAPKGEGYEGYGKNKKVSVISKDANVVELDNSERYLKSKGDKIDDESLAKKLGTNSWSDAFYKMNNEDLSNAEIKDIEKYTKVLYREAQLAVKDFVLKENPNADVIKFKMEDEVNPTQYWVLNKNVLKDPSIISPNTPSKEQKPSTVTEQKDRFREIEKEYSDAVDAYGRNVAGSQAEKDASAKMKELVKERNDLHKELFKDNKPDEKSDEVHDSVLDDGKDMPEGYSAKVIDSYYEPVVGRNHTVVEVINPKGGKYYIDVNTYKRRKIGEEYGEKPPTPTVTEQGKEEVTESETPIKDKWQERVDAVDIEKEYTDLNQLEVGDVVLSKTGTLGFVKKINPKKLIIETSYGGWGNNDITIQELSINKNDVSVFKKPKKNQGKGVERSVATEVKSELPKADQQKKEIKNAQTAESQDNTSNKQSNKPTEESIGTSETPIEPPKGTEPPSPPPQTSTEVIDRGGDSPERQFSKRMLRDEDLTEDVKEGVYKNLNYIRHTDKMAVEEANRLINETGIDEVQNLVMNDNDIKPKVRVTLGQILIRKYNELAKNADNEPERLHYLDKTIQTANYVTEKLGTEAGQTIQAFTMWSQLSPEGQLRAANQDVERIAKEKMRRREKDVNVISDKFKKANEEAADEAVKQSGITEEPTKEQKSKAQEKIDKARKKRQELIDKRKKDKGKGGNLYSSIGGLTPEGIEFAGEIAKTYIQEGVANVELLIEKIAKHLEDVTGKPVNDDIKKQIGEISDKHLAASDRELIGDALKNRNIQIGKIVKEHYTVVDKAKKQLAQKLMDEAGMEQSNAKELASKIEAAFDRIATRKKRNILYNEKARFDKIQKSFQADKKTEPKTVQSEIIKYSNLGAFENADMMNMLADKFGLKKLTSEQAGELMRLAEKVQKAPEGSPKNDATEDLLSYRAKLLGSNIGEAAQSVWYANVLSGYRTHEKNIVSTFFNSWAELGAEMVKDPKAIPYLVGGYIKGISKRGLVEAKHTLTTGRSPIHIKKIETPNALERNKFKGGGWNPANWFKYVTRLMVAEDVLSFQGLKEARAYQLARREAARQGKNTWTREGWNKVNDVLFHTRERMLIAEDQAQTEGLKKGTTEFRRRVYELMENSRPEQMTEDAYNFAANGTFNYNSTGTLGAITNAVSKALDAVNVKGVKPLRLIVPFTRIITNVVNNSLDFTPVGLVRAARGVRGFRGFEESSITKGSFKELTREERQRLVAKAATGIVFAATFQALHAAGVLTLTGGGSDDKKKLQQMKEQGWQPYSIKIGDKWYSYQYTPLVFMLGYLGNMNDQAEYGDVDEQTLLKQMETASLRMGNQVVDMTWINSAGTFLGALADGSPSEQGKNVENALAGMARGAVPFSQAITQTTGLYESIFNVPAKQVNNSWESLIQDIPVARNYLNDKVNALGQPVRKDVDVFVSSEKQDPVWKLLADKKGWVATISRNSAFKFDQRTGQDIPLTDNEFYDFTKLRGGKIYKDIQALMDNGVPVQRGKNVTVIPVDKATSKEFNDVLSKIESQATKEAREELFGEKAKDKNQQKVRDNWNDKIKSIILKQ